ncbi:ribosome-recycling factor [Candidatus Karelsulcia muelleri]|uniref:ribosome-recycling factor n=1 Tax=Candidatus Karelsulcia muelleri TaxID=336810 RepID=UPI0035C91BB5
MKESFDLIKKFKLEVKDKKEKFKKKIFKIIIDRINENFLDSINIEYYGNKVPINNISTIVKINAITVLIKPWEKKYLNIIYKTLLKEDRGFLIINDGKMIKLKISKLTEETRKKLIKKVKFFLEKKKIEIRNLRNEVNKKLKKFSYLEEDFLKKKKNEIQNITDQYLEKVNFIFKQKEKEILTI